MAIALKPTITLKEVLEFLFNRSAAPAPFSIVAVTADFKRKKFGDILKLDNVIVPARHRNLPASERISEGGAHGERRQNNTINLLNKNTDEYVKVHLDLICEFNDKKVVW